MELTPCVSGCHRGSSSARGVEVDVEMCVNIHIIPLPCSAAAAVVRLYSVLQRLMER